MMRSLKLVLLALVASRANAYLDTSPFFMFSTSELLLPTSNLQSAPSLTSEVSHILSTCPSEYYVLVQQPGVDAADFPSSKDAPGLSQYLAPSRGSSIRSSAGIPEVAGYLDPLELRNTLVRTCGGRLVVVDEQSGKATPNPSKSSNILSVIFDLPSHGQRKQDLLRNDALLTSVLTALPSQNYTVVFTTSAPVVELSSPEEVREYAMELQDPLLTHTDLKRDVGIQKRESSSNETLVDGPLFTRYQFLSPGLFMGLLVALPLLLILYFAISGIASIQVTYAAYDKDNGQLALKKAQ